MSSPIEDLIHEAKAKENPCRDAYEFAEWLCQVKQHFGNFRYMGISQMESCYDEAMGWWEIGNKA